LVKWAKLVLLISILIIALWAGGLVLIVVVGGVLMALLWIAVLIETVVLNYRKSTGRTRPVRVRPKAPTPDMIIPKWGAGQRRSVRLQHAEWQDQFDALDSGKKLTPTKIERRA
jgi:hypothetical protein